MCVRFLFFLLIVASARAQGGPPMITDDPGTPGDGHWEINTALTTERRTGERATEMPLVDLNYGVGERVQLKYEASWLRVSDEAGVRSGFSNSLAGVKWRFYDAGEKQWSVSTYPQVEFNNPDSHSAHRGLVGRGTTMLLPIEVMRDFGGLSFNADFGFTGHSSENGWFGGVAVGQDLGHEVEIAAELHFDSAARFQTTEALANVGFRFGLSKQCTLLASMGRGVHPARDSRVSLIAYFGLQTRL